MKGQRKFSKLIAHYAQGEFTDAEELYKTLSASQVLDFEEYTRNSMKTYAGRVLHFYNGVQKRIESARPKPEAFETDLFTTPELWPADLKAVLSQYETEDETYENCANMLEACEAIGYTFEYSLDAVPYDLRLTTKCVIREDMQDLLIPVGEDYVQYLDADQFFYYRWIPTNSEGGEQFQILTTDKGWQDADSIDFDFNILK